MNYLLIGLGGFLGANVRYLVATWVAEQVGMSFPYGTLLINVSGSFVIGLFLTALGERTPLALEYRLFFAMGFLGAYTTFSTFSYETLALIQQQQWGAALGYMGSSVVLGLIAVMLGVALGQRLS